MTTEEYSSLYSKQIRNILEKGDIDLATITTKSIRKQLEKDNNVQFQSKEEKKAINNLIGQIYDEVTEQAEEEEEEEEQENTEEKSYDLSDDEYIDSIKDSQTSKSTVNHTNLVSSEDEMNSDSVDSDVYDDDYKASSKAGTKRKRADTKSKSKKKPAKKRSGGGGGLNAPLILSEKLGGLLGEKEMSRTQIVKKLWEYIKSHNLQDPRDKRYIISDSKLKKVFGVERFSGFSMSKMLNDHLTKLDGTSCKKEKTEEEEKEEKAKKAAKKRAAKGKSGDKPKRAAPNNGFNKPMLLSPTLSSFLGDVRELPRPQVVKQIWEYIKENNLQDTSDKRYILCDDKLFSVFKTKRVHMFQMNKILADHLKTKEDVVGVKEEVVIDDPKDDLVKMELL
jgi:upstream activation factor subunit UAF30